jgi:hypothetical protein
MTELKLLIFPYNKEMIIPVGKKEYERLIKMIYKCKSGWIFDLGEIEEFGFLGFELYCDNSIQVYVNDENIFYTNDNVTQFLIDPKKKVNSLLLKIAIKKYYKELVYYFNVRRCNKERRQKLRR